MKLAPPDGRRSPSSPQIVKKARQGDRRQDRAQDPDRHAYYAATPKYGNALAERADEHHRLGPPRRAERVPHGGAHDKAVPKAAPGTRRTSRTRSTTSWSRTTSPRSTLVDSSKYAEQIEQLLLDETPVIFPYFYNFLDARREEASPASSRPRRQHVPEQGVDRLATRCRPTAARLRGGRRLAPASPELRLYERIAARCCVPRPPSRARARHAVAAEPDRLRARPGAARQCRRAHARPVRRPGAVDALNHELGLDRPLLTQYLRLDRATSSTATSASPTPPRAGQRDLVARALRNRSSSRCRLRPRRAARHPRRRRSPRSRPTGRVDRIITIGGLSVTVVPEFVSAHRR